MTQTAETTQPAEQATQQTSQELTANSQQPTASNEPTAKSQEPAKSAFISDGKLAKGEQEPSANSQQPKASTQPTANSQEPKANEQPTANSQELIAKVTALEARLDAIESQRTTERRTAEVERIIAPLSDTLKAVYRRTPFATLTDEEFATLRETISKEVTELATADKPRGAVFSRPTASKPTDGKASDKETDEVLRRLNL